jgi:hypothetical protein
MKSLEKNWANHITFTTLEWYRWRPFFVWLPIRPRQALLD